MIWGGRLSAPPLFRPGLRRRGIDCFLFALPSVVAGLWIGNPYFRLTRQSLPAAVLWRSTECNGGKGKRARQQGFERAAIVADGGGSIFCGVVFQLPNFILASLMYTLLGRVLLGFIVAPDSKNYIWRFFCRVTTDPSLTLISYVTPNGGTVPVVLWLFGVVWLFWLRIRFAVCLRSFRGLFPHGLSCRMNRNAYLIAIAFFRHDQWPVQSQDWLLFALLHMQILAGAAVRQRLVDAYVLVPDGVDATIILAAFRRRSDEHLIGAKDDSNDVSM
ncbi:MAG: hypothetical protein R3D62_09915 [Xanthobacteraceae bacterium]